MLAIASAASDLRAQQKLDVDLVMIVEGEEEAGSAGFQDAIRKNRVGLIVPLSSRAGAPLTPLWCRHL